MQRRRSSSRSADCRDLLDRHVGVLARERMSLRITNQDLRQRANLRRLAVIPRGFHPRIFPLCLPAAEFGFSLSLPWVQRLFALIVGVHHILSDSLPEARIFRRLESLYAGKIALMNVAAGQIVSRATAIERQIRNR